VGIDPGSLHTGFGVVESRGRGLRMLRCGVVSPEADLPLAEKLALIHRAILAVVGEFNPKAMALEKVFTHVDPRGALTLAHARAASILAASLSGVPVFEYAPSLVKSVVAGSGRADKTQVAFMVSNTLGLEIRERSDATDALALAICHHGQLVPEGSNARAASRGRASSWRNMTADDQRRLGYRVDD
jgi:crossover junction endodeoxyribonuclease RuvC